MLSATFSTCPTLNAASGVVIFRRVRRVAESVCWLRRVQPLCPTVCTSVCVPIHKYQPDSLSKDSHEIWCFYVNRSRKSRFGYNRTKISITSHDDQSMFYFCRRHQFPMKALLLTVTYRSTIRRENALLCSSNKYAPHNYVLPVLPVLFYL
jgi:hypothetical protein